MTDSKGFALFCAGITFTFTSVAVVGIVVRHDDGDSIEMSTFTSQPVEVQAKLPMSSEQSTLDTLSLPIETPVSTATRLVPPIQVVPTTVDTCNHEGLHCLPFAPPTSTGCDEMNFYRIEFGLPDRFSDQPRTGPKRQMGIGFRESSCNNTLINRESTPCCGGYFQIGWGNISAPGYAAAGIWSYCEITRASDYIGDTPLQKQKSACAASGLYNYHVLNGPYGTWPWDAFL